MDLHEKLVAPCHAEYSKEQTDSAGRGDFQELTGLVYPSFVLRIFDFERCEGVQSLVFAKWRCAGVESCKNSTGHYCFFVAGDDATCLKSGKDEDGRRRGEPCENVIIKNNTVLHGHGGFVIGSEMSGGVRNVYVSGCSFVGTDVGLRLRVPRTWWRSGEHFHR